VLVQQVAKNLEREHRENHEIVEGVAGCASAAQTKDFVHGRNCEIRSTSEMTPSRWPRKRLRLRIPNLILSLTYQAHGIHPIVLLTAWALRLSADSALYSCSEILAGPGEGKAAKRRSALERVEGVSKLLNLETIRWRAVVVARGHDNDSDISRAPAPGSWPECVQRSVLRSSRAP